MVNGEETTLGVTGALWRGAMVMYDRETGTYWSQVNATAIDGPHQGDTLREIPSMVTTWGEWRRLHPGTLVLEKPPLDGSPYESYYSSEEAYGVFGRANPDDRLPGKDLVIGVQEAGVTAAVSLSRLREAGVINGFVGETPVAWVAVSGPGAAAFERRLDGIVLDLAFNPAGRLVSGGEGAGVSEFDLATGEAISGPLAGRTLRRLPARRAYWYSWVSFHPDTVLLKNN
jgi:hypothetical protein